MNTRIPRHAVQFLILINWHYFLLVFVIRGENPDVLGNGLNRECNVWGPGDGPLEMYFEKTRTRRRKREKDSERYSPESGHIRKRYGDWREYLVVR